MQTEKDASMMKASLVDGEVIIEKQYSITEIAQLSGLTYLTIYKYVQEGRIKAHKINDRHIRIAESEVERFLNGTPL